MQQNKTYSNNQNEKASYRIVGGSPTLIGRYPYLVALIQKVSDAAMYQLCGGVLIAPDVVLTAAHCAPKINTVQIGRYDLSDWSGNFETFNIVQSISHPLFNNIDFFYDYALLKLSGKSTYAYAQLNHDREMPTVGSYVTVIGWGATETGGQSSSIPNEVPVQCLSNTQCSADYASEKIINTMICASSPGKDACQGDSGGPLIMKGDNSIEDVLVGVVSWGYSCADPLHPGVYSRVSTVIDWIEENTCTLSPQSCIQLTSEYFNKSDVPQNVSFTGNTTLRLAIKSPSSTSPQAKKDIFKSLSANLSRPMIISTIALGFLLLCSIYTLAVVKGVRCGVRKRSRKTEHRAANNPNMDVAVPTSP